MDPPQFPLVQVPETMETDNTYHYDPQEVVVLWALIHAMRTYIDVQYAACRRAVK